MYGLRNGSNQPVIQTACIAIHTVLIAMQINWIVIEPTRPDIQTIGIAIQTYTFANQLTYSLFRLMIIAIQFFCLVYYNFVFAIEIAQRAIGCTV
jgi:hypothetical protein